MKKITLMIFLIIGAASMQAQINLLTNGDFEAGQVDWIGNAFNVQEENGNKFNFANIQAAGNAYDVNLSQVLEIVQGKTYTLSFDASSDRNRTMIAGIGLNEAPFDAATETVNLTTTTQNFTLTLTASNFGNTNSRVLFDMGAEIGVVVIDNVVLTEVTGGGGNAGTNLLTNGDFEAGQVDWIGNAFNVQEENGNKFNFANVQAAGNAFDVNLSQVLEIVQGKTYTLSFDASSDRNRTMIAGIGLNQAPFDAATETVNLTTTLQNFTLTLTASNFGNTNSRVLFDMGAAVGVVVIDNVVLTEVTGGGGNAGTNLLTNGDFEAGQVDWIGNAFNVQEENGNKFNFANIQAAGNAFDVNLSQVLEIVQGKTYTLSFDASSDRNRTMIAGIGLNEAPFDAATETVNLTTTTQNFTLTLTASNFGNANSRVLFDMGAEIGVVVIDNVVLTEVTGGGGGGGTGDELVRNGDFEAGQVEWIGNAFNVQEENGNKFNFANVTAAGQAFAVNLSQVLTIVEGQSYTMKFDASSDRNRTIIVGIGLNEQPFTADVQTVNLTTATQTFTLTLSSAGFGGTNSRVLFDMGAEIGVVVIDNVSLVQNGVTQPNVPEVAAPASPNRPAQDVFSIYSDRYTNQPNVVFGAFNVGTQDIETITVNGDNFLKIDFNQPNSEFLLVDWGTTLDLSNMTHFHMDFWTDTSLDAGLIVNPLWSNHVGDNGQTSGFGLTNPVTTFGKWVSIDVPLSQFDFGDNNNQRRDALRQFVVTVAGANAGTRTVYFDNIYLHKNTTLSTESITKTDIKIYPNPSTSQWSVNTTGEIIESIELFDLSGKRIIVINPNSATSTIDASSLAKGFYMARITTEFGQNSIKLIKN